MGDVVKIHSRKLVAKLVETGYLQPRLQRDHKAIEAAIERWHQDSRAFLANLATDSPSR